MVEQADISQHIQNKSKDQQQKALLQNILVRLEKAVPMRDTYKLINELYSNIDFLVSLCAALAVKGNKLTNSNYMLDVMNEHKFESERFDKIVNELIAMKKFCGIETQD